MPAAPGARAAPRRCPSCSPLVVWSPLTPGSVSVYWTAPELPGGTGPGAAAAFPAEAERAQNTSDAASAVRSVPT